MDSFPNTTNNMDLNGVYETHLSKKRVMALLGATLLALAAFVAMSGSGDPPLPL